MRFAFAMFLLIIPALVMAAPKIVVDQAVYDFGEIKEGTIVTHAFVIRNEGTDPLVFTRRPYSSCGCTVAALPKEVLLPGESLELVATFDSTGFGGRHVRKEIRVYTNDPENPVTVLALVGYVRAAEPHERSAWNLQYSLYLLIDVRSPEEYARAHLLGAINIPFRDLSQKISEFSTQVLIFLYDNAGEIALQAAAMLEQKGYRFARALKGGLVEWQSRYGNLFIEFGEEGPFTFQGEPRSGQHAVDPQQLLSRYVIVLDVRPPEEFAAGHLAGAINVDPGTLPQWIVDHLPRSLPQGVKLSIWCVDEDGTRSCPAAKYIRSQGYEAWCVLGGLSQWRKRYDNLLIVPSE
jgi:rhodanese-related sulfurtransferase